MGRGQLFDLGLNRPQVDALVRRGHLVAETHTVYRRPGAPRGRVQEAMTAVLRSREPARVSGLLVLALLGCEGYEVSQSPFTLLVPPGHRITNVDFPWRPDPAPDRDGATVQELPALTPARTVFELAVDLEDDDALLLAADRCRWRTGTRAADLAYLASRLPDHPGLARLEMLGLLDAARPESPGERSLAEIAGLLPFLIEWQVWVAPDLRVDALIRDAAIVLEYDGEATHEDTRDRAGDAERDARLEALGYLVVHLTRADLRHPEVLRARLVELRAHRLAQLADVR